MSVGAVFCPHCHSSREPGTVFCGKCGGKVEAQPPAAQVTAALAAAFCPHCGTGVGLGSAFCPSCGSRIGPTPELAPARTYPGYSSSSYGRGSPISQAEGSSLYTISHTTPTEISGTSSTLQSVSTDNFCNKCGGKLRHESRFCPSCGNPVAKPQPAVTTVAVGPSEPPHSEERVSLMPSPIPRLCKTCGN